MSENRFSSEAPRQFLIYALARALAGLGRHYYFRAQHAHEAAALDGEGLGHADDAVVAALRADHGHRLCKSTSESALEQ